MTKLIKIKVKTNSSEQSIEKISKEILPEEELDFYFVKLKTLPTQGEANLELIKFLSKYFKSEVKIKSGFTSKIKLIEIENEI